MSRPKITFKFSHDVDGHTWHRLGHHELPEDPHIISEAANGIGNEIVANSRVDRLLGCTIFFVLVLVFVLVFVSR